MGTTEKQQAVITTTNEATNETQQFHVSWLANRETACCGKSPWEHYDLPGVPVFADELGDLHGRMWKCDKCGTSRFVSAGWHPVESCTDDCADRPDEVTTLAPTP